MKSTNDKSNITNRVLPLSLLGYDGKKSPCQADPDDNDDDKPPSAART